MDISLDIAAKILSPIIAGIIATVIKWYLEGRPRLVTYLVHASAIPLPGQEGQALQVNTHTIVVANSGKKTAHNIRIGHAHLPQGFQLWPPVTHTVSTTPNGAAEILIPTLVPGEQVSVSYLYFPPVTWQQINAYAKSDETMAKVITVFPSPQLSRLALAGLWVLLLVGASTVIYWLFMLVAHWLTPGV